MNFYRRPYGDGWALVGDAGYHKDPILAIGISDAFRDAQLLADASDAGDDLFGTIAGTVPAERFFAPDDVARILVPLDAAA